jgi:hypothetical protein
MKANPKSKPQRRNTGWMLFGALTAASLGGLAAVLIMSYGQQAASAEPTIPPGVSLTSWFDNGKGGLHVLQIREGSAPPAGVRLTGTVLTDTDCAPDAQGLNHCHNNIDLGNGRILAVINNHAMNRYPCLQPGQRLAITRLNANWVVAWEGQGSRFN